MAEGMRVSGVGKGARRTDLDRAAKVQRQAKVQNAMSRGPMTSTAPAAASIPTVGIFHRTTRPNEPITAGVDAGEGPGSEVLMTPVDAPDQLATFARAMYMANPTPQLRRIVEAFEEEGR